MIDVNLMCPIPLLIFLIRGKKHALSAGKEMRWAVMLCCTSALENLIAHPGPL